MKNDPITEGIYFDLEDGEAFRQACLEKLAKNKAPGSENPREYEGVLDKVKRMWKSYRG